MPGVGGSVLRGQRSLLFSHSYFDFSIRKNGFCARNGRRDPVRGQMEPAEGRRDASHFKSSGFQGQTGLILWAGCP